MTSMIPIPAQRRLASLRRLAAPNAVLVSVALLAACGGGDGSVNPSAPSAAVATVTVSGVAAVGAPLVGATVSVRCAAAVATASATTSSAGAWTLVLPAAALPCALQASGGTRAGVANLQAFHSYAAAAGVANITPFSDLLVGLAAASVPGTWFSALDASHAPALGSTLSAAAASLVQGLASAGYAPPAGFDPIGTVFAATAGDTYDALLDAFGAALPASQIGYAQMLADVLAAAPGSLGAHLPARAAAGGGGGGTTPPPPTSTAVVGPTLEMGSAVCGLIPDGSAYCWGFGSNGETGNAAGGSSVPVAVQGGLTFATVSTYGPHTCALTPAGDAYCWGSGSLGALGDGNTNGHLSFAPVLVSGGLKFKAISVGLNFACALVADGTAYCWGDNRQGQLGLGAADSTPRGTPTAMPNFKWQSISARQDVACGIDTTGAAYCWGWSSGVVGSGSYLLAVVGAPMAVPGGVTFKSVVTSSDDSACGLTPAGAAYCWGIGMLGTGIADSATAAGATPVTGGLTFTRLAASAGRFCGITAAGATYCWGVAFGNAPVAVAVGIVAAEVATRGVATCVVATDGKAWCFGSNFLGELGDGTNTNHATAAPVLGGLTFKLP